MRRSLLLSLVVLAACHHGPRVLAVGQGAGPVLVGELETVPPLRGVRGKVLAFFTEDLSEPLDDGFAGPGFRSYELGHLEPSGAFVVQLSRPYRQLYLRALVVRGEGGGRSLYGLLLRAAPLIGSKVAYVGKVVLVRGENGRIVIRNDAGTARAALRERGLGDLTGERWTTALFEEVRDLRP